MSRFDVTQIAKSSGRILTPPPPLNDGFVPLPLVPLGPCLNSDRAIAWVNHAEGVEHIDRRKLGQLLEQEWVHLPTLVADVLEAKGGE